MSDNIFETFLEQDESRSARHWEQLIQKMMEGEVIPVIGPEFLAEDKSDGNGWVNPHQILINRIVGDLERYKKGIRIDTRHKTFSELLYDDNFPSSMKKDIYSMIGKLCDRPDIKIGFNPSQLLIKLLKVCKFRFVITTSFTPIVEKAMRDIWGDDLRIMNFNNNPLENQDIKKAEEIRIPTVYYMFGKVCTSENKFVVSDSDMLSFCRSWLSSGPNTLTSVLKKKYILMLGNSYSDWLCRFVWYSMKTELNVDPKGMVVDPYAEESLLQFMKRIDTFTQNDPVAVINKIEHLLEEKNKAREDAKFDTPEIGTDVFISYSRRNQVEAKNLYDALIAKGLKVWYDKKNLAIGDKFMEEIKTAIKMTKVFVPLFTKSIINEKNESHPYRTEWTTAIDVASSYGRNFIFPICENGFDFYSAKIPSAIQNCDADFYIEQEPDFKQFAETVFKFIINL